MKTRVVLFSLLIVVLILNIYIFFQSNKDAELQFHGQSTAASVQQHASTEQTNVFASLTPSPQETKLLFTGDVMLGRTVMTKSIELHDYLYPFRKTAEKLKQADLTIVNLENPIISNCPPHTGGFVFCSEPESVSALEYAGVDVVNLANNHTYNWGNEGFEQTKQYLSEKGIDSVGYANVVIKESAGMGISFVGFDFVSRPYVLNEAETGLIKSADINSDFLIANIHWGNEYHNSANHHQRNMATELVSLGVDLIIGHHPHWVQDVDCFGQINNEYKVVKNISVEQLRNGETCPFHSSPVYYSLGNFVFDQMWSEETKKGGALLVALQNKNIVNIEFLPTYMSSWAQPGWIE